MSELVLRKASKADLPVIAEFWLAMFEEVGKHYESDFQSGWRERFVQYFHERTNRREASYFVAVGNERVVGCAGAILRDGYPFVIHGISNGYILGVYVHPGYRARGVARRLTELAVAFLREVGAKNILLHASPFGRSIYEKLGFVPTNEMRLSEDSSLTYVPLARSI
jgi:ribosomal protein S18 acetylase RimI-like enzyme